jgi:hypothetical protein
MFKASVAFRPQHVGYSVSQNIELDRQEKACCEICIIDIAVQWRGARK